MENSNHLSRNNRILRNKIVINYQLLMMIFFINFHSLEQISVDRIVTNDKEGGRKRRNFRGEIPYRKSSITVA